MLSFSSAASLLIFSAGSSPTRHEDSSPDLIAYALLILSGVIFLALAMQAVYFLIRRREHQNAVGHNGMSICASDMVDNTELVVTLLRHAVPGELLAYLDKEAISFDGDLERFLTVLQNPYEDDLRPANSDGNAYLALARTHRAICAVIDDVDQLHARVTAMSTGVVTRDQASIIATRTMVSGALLACAIGGLAIGIIQVF